MYAFNSVEYINCMDIIISNCAFNPVDYIDCILVHNFSKLLNNVHIKCSSFSQAIFKANLIIYKLKCMWHKNCTKATYINNLIKIIRISCSLNFKPYPAVIMIIHRIIRKSLACQ